MEEQYEETYEEQPEAAADSGPEYHELDALLQLLQDQEILSPQLSCVDDTQLHPLSGPLGGTSDDVQAVTGNLHPGLDPLTDEIASVHQWR